MQRLATPAKRLRQRGVSLIEAMVALAVLGFGMLGLVALQTSMRLNSDVAKQRSEATRLAHTAIESRRTHTVMAATVGKLAWADLASKPVESIAGVNATYQRTVSISDGPDGNSKLISVTVTWRDRSDVESSVQLVATLTATLPEIAASVGAPPLAMGTTTPLGRHPAIPRAAIDGGTGKSTYSPPGAGNLRWVFDNTNGYIVSRCTEILADTCTTVYLRLLQGYVWFATGNSQPTPAMAESPPSSTPSQLAVQIPNLSPASAAAFECFYDRQSRWIEYVCAVPVDPLSGSYWSGKVELDLAPWGIASSINDDNDHKFRVCRYTPVADCQPAVSSVIWGAAGSTANCSGTSPTPNRKMTNAEHPLNYLKVTEPLINQNYLVIRAGNDHDPFACPADNPSTPYVNTNTWHHQPSS